MSRPSLRSVWLVLAAGALLVAGWNASTQLDADAARVAKFGAATLLYAAAGFVANLLLAMAAWIVLVRAAFGPATAREAAAVFAWSLPGKYLPGGVWQPAARLKLMARPDRPLTSVAVVVALEQLLALASLAVLLAAAAVALGGTGVPPELAALVDSVTFMPLILGAAGAAVLATLGSRRLRRLLASVSSPAAALLRTGRFWLAFVLTLASQVAFVLGYLALLPVALVSDAARALFSAAVVLGATLAGFLAPFAPGGLGVREAAIVAGADLGASVAALTMAVVVARLLSVAAELLLFALWLRPGLRP